MNLEADYEPDAHVVKVQELFITHQSAVRGFLLSMIPDMSLADDLVQETFLVVTRKAHSFELGTSFLAWVRMIARYKALETLRRNTRQAGNFALPEEVLDVLSAEQENPPIDTEIYLQYLDHCISKLAPQARRAIELRYSQGHRVSEIARLLGCTTPSASVALSRARAFLRNCVDQQLQTSTI